MASSLFAKMGKSMSKAGRKTSKALVQGRIAAMQKMSHAEVTPEEPEIAGILQRLKATKNEIATIADVARYLYDSRIIEATYQIDLANQLSSVRTMENDAFSTFMLAMGDTVAKIESIDSEHCTKMKELFVKPLERFRDVDIPKIQKFKLKYKQAKSNYDVSLSKWKASLTKHNNNNNNNNSGNDGSSTDNSTESDKLEAIYNKKKEELESMRREFKAAVIELERKKNTEILPMVQIYWHNYVQFINAKSHCVNVSKMPQIDSSFYASMGFEMTPENGMLSGNENDEDDNSDSNHNNSQNVIEIENENDESIDDSIDNDNNDNNDNNEHNENNSQNNSKETERGKKNEERLKTQSMVIDPKQMKKWMNENDVNSKKKNVNNDNNENNDNNDSKNSKSNDDKNSKKLKQSSLTIPIAGIAKKEKNDDSDNDDNNDNNDNDDNDDNHDSDENETKQDVNHPHYRGLTSDDEKSKAREERDNESAKRQKLKLKRHQSDMAALSHGGIVYRAKIPPIEEHEGMVFIEEAMGYQENGQLKLAMKKYKVGIAMLESTLSEIDRNSQKREWHQKINEIRHKMNRCKFEIENKKRQKMKEQRKEERLKKAEKKILEEKKKIDAAKAKALSEALGASPKVFEQSIQDWRSKVENNENDESKNDEKKENENENDKEMKSLLNHSGVKPKRKSKQLHSKSYGTSSRSKDKKKGNNKNKGDKGDESNNDKDGKDTSMDDDKLTKHEKELRDRIMGDLMIGKPNAQFVNVIGLNNVKLALYESIILPSIRPDLFESINSKNVNGILLFGPPGNGKTMIAKCVASECDATFFNISASSITSKFVGDAERIVRYLFKMARIHAPSIIFIDEIDSLLTARGSANEAESSRRVKTEFLIQFDGVQSENDSKKSITVIGATNLPQQLDDAVLRRFSKRIMVPNPDKDARYDLLRTLMSQQRHELSENDFRNIVKNTDGYSCSDLTTLVNDAAMGPIRSMNGSLLLKAKKSEIPLINKNHFKNSLKNIRASVPPQNLKHYFEWDEQFGSKLFLTMDVLPENMKSKALMSVNEEKKLRKQKDKENEENEKETANDKDTKNENEN